MVAHAAPYGCASGAFRAAGGVRWLNPPPRITPAATAALATVLAVLVITTFGGGDPAAVQDAAATLNQRGAHAEMNRQLSQLLAVAAFPRARQ